MSLPSFTPSPRPRLRLIIPGQEDPHSRLSSGMRLTEFFSEWYLPIVLVGERAVSESTIGEYRTSLAWWAKLTGDPPIAHIDEYVVADFVTRIRTATFSRGLATRQHLLSKWTSAKHCANIRYVLARCGPTVDSARPGKALLSAVPRVPVRKPRHAAPKPCFGLTQARRIVAARDKMVYPSHDWCTPAQWWLALLSLFFYTGLRSGTVLRLRWDWLSEREDGWWLDVPEHAVPKTHKATAKPLSGHAMQALEPLRGHGDLLVPWPHCYEHLRRVHESLQTAAGVSPILSVQAWRRTHGNELARLGANYGSQLAQQSLDHSDSRTTENFYVDVRSQLLRKLPSLLQNDDGQQQLRLF